jgi:choline-glycine betaine transporter
MYFITCIVYSIPRLIHEVCIHVLVYPLLFSYLSLSSQYNATIEMRQLKTANNHPPGEWREQQDQNFIKRDF